MNSEEEFYDAETGESRTLFAVSVSKFVNMLCFIHQGWSQMIPVRSVSKMPWCLTTSRGLMAAHMRMECGSTGEASYTALLSKKMFL